MIEGNEARALTGEDRLLHNAIVSVLRNRTGADLFTLERLTGTTVDVLLPIAFELGVVVAEWRYVRRWFGRPREYLWFTHRAASCYSPQ